jgi:predicted DNA-binding ribbon-helix-helix protein
MKSVRIGDKAYKFLKKIASEEKRTITATLDLFVEIYEEAHKEKVVSTSISRKGSR